MNDMTTSSEFNDTNSTCPLSLLWSQATIDSERSALYACIIATVTHSVFWLQFILCPSVRQKTMQWLYAYLATDILLLFRFFFTFIVHTTSKECVPNRAWFLLICYFEAIVDDYLNTLEVYILLALNICRYIQIARNRNVYTTYIRSLICAHVTIYLIPLISYIIQLSVGWAQVVVFVGGSCDLSITNIYVQVVNIIWGYGLPIILNIFVIYYNMKYVHLTSRLRRTQHHVSAREKYHRSLVIQFLVFYTVWLLLWSPNLIAYQFRRSISNLTIITSLLNYIEIALDPIIISALDVRFQKVWRHLWTHFRNTIICNRRNQRRIVPTRIGQNPRTIVPAQHQTVPFPT
jgi:hypothetical protein